MPSMTVSTLRVHTARERPDLYQQLNDPAHALNQAWPEYLDYDMTFKENIPWLSEIEELAQFQFLIENRGSVVALGRSVPFHWAQLAKESDQKLTPSSKVLQSLPDGGYDAILSCAVEQCRQRQKCTKQYQPPVANALSTISITVTPEFRGRGLPALLLATMKEAAIRQSLRALVVPLRPAMKACYPSVDMPEYLSWVQKDQGDSPLNITGGKLPFDPWFRTHMRLGAQVIRLAMESMVVEGTRDEWTSWTGLDIDASLRQLVQEPGMAKSSYYGPYVEVAFPGGLVPLKVYQERNLCSYVEPNLWLHHPLGS